jgi:Raf kinase inhibitor-like YbhB/YbcL family protein
MALQLRSENFADGDYLAPEHLLSEDFGFGGTGGNVSPAVGWSGAPDGTGSFALTCFDPDAPTGSGFWHWLVVNLPSEVAHLPAGAGNGEQLPGGALHVRSDFGTTGYGGPCPPEGDHPHRYLFTVHALDVPSLPVDVNTPAAIVGFQLHLHTIEKASLMGLSRR